MKWHLFHKNFPWKKLVLILFYAIFQKTTKFCIVSQEFLPPFQDQSSLFCNTCHKFRQTGLKFLGSYYSALFKNKKFMLDKTTYTSKFAIFLAYEILCIYFLSLSFIKYFSQKKVVLHIEKIFCNIFELMNITHQHKKYH